MLDFDLAELYGVPTSRLNEQVTRNRKRFPADFMFRLTGRETEILRSQLRPQSSHLRSQFVISNIGRNDRPKIGTPAIQIQQDSNS